MSDDEGNRLNDLETVMSRKFDQLAEMIATLSVAQEKTNARIDKQIWTLESRSADSDEFAVLKVEHKNNFRNFQKDIPGKLTFCDMPKFKVEESPLTHIRAFICQMSFLGIEEEH